MGDDRSGFNNPSVNDKEAHGNYSASGYVHNPYSTVRKSDTHGFQSIPKSGSNSLDHSNPVNPSVVPSNFNTVRDKIIGIFEDPSSLNNSHSISDDSNNLQAKLIANEHSSVNTGNFTGSYNPPLQNNYYGVQNFNPVLDGGVNPSEPRPENTYYMPSTTEYKHSFDQESNIPPKPVNFNGVPQIADFWQNKAPEIYDYQKFNVPANYEHQQPYIPGNYEYPQSINLENYDYQQAYIPENIVNKDPAYYLTSEKQQVPQNDEENKMPPDLGPPPRVSHINLNNFIQPFLVPGSDENNHHGYQNPDANINNSYTSVNQNIINQGPLSQIIPEDLTKSIMVKTLNNNKNKTYSEIAGRFDHPCNKASILPLKIETTTPLTDIDTPVDTISKTWIKMELMKNVAKFNNSFTNCIDTLKFEYKIIAWKKSRGDGNCYFRSVISRYFEIIFGFYSSLQNCEIFKSILEELKQKFENSRKIPTYYKDSIAYIYACVQKLIDIKTNDSYAAFNTALFWLQNQEFDINLVRVSRVLCLNAYCNKKKDWKDIGVYNQATKRLILDMGTEAEGLVLVLLPLSLDIQVVQYNIFDKVLIEAFPSDIQSNIKIHIVRRGGHYDIVYTIQECELDLYNLDLGTYHYIN